MLDEYLKFAENVAQEAGAIMCEFFYAKDLDVERKSDDSPVTVADKKINTLLIERVTEQYPEHGVLGEEESYQSEREQLWVCDPIDGTDGFIAGVPTAMFSLAFVLDGVVLVAVLYDPFSDRRFSATKGGGATVNGVPLKVSTTNSIALAKVATVGSVKQLLERQQLFKGFIEQGTQVKILPGNVFKSGLVANGKIDGYIFPGLSAHDIAGAKLVIEEAGGKVTDLYGNEQRYDKKINGAVLSNGRIHNGLLKALNEYGVDRYLGF